MSKKEKSNRKVDYLLKIADARVEKLKSTITFLNKCGEEEDRYRVLISNLVDLSDASSVVVLNLLAKYDESVGNSLDNQMINYSFSASDLDDVAEEDED